MASLPQPRHFLTSLINAISDIPLSQSGPQPQRQHEPSNPLKAVPQSYRPLLTTLHVLFPTLLLPALDLLDRGLVTRLWLVPKKSDEARYESSDGEEEDEEAGGGGQGEEAGIYEPEPAVRGDEIRHRRATSPSAEDGKGGEDGEDEQEQEPVSHIFTVRSSQSTHPRRRKEVLLGGVAEDPAQKMYIVRLGAWNCTCAAFAFAAFPGGGSQAFSVDGGGSRDEDVRRDMDGDVVAGEVGEDDWSFGGVSLDGTGEGGSVPCCKHLLACLLAERWQSGLGSYIEERRVGRNEMAGIVADV
ncbi:hypothetical protein CONLIGDRAFT_504570 [Coniochaeta ligniaria NRRL 30616]|uniref:SWIM-type domain-containing protein n=1 Tax=Coniochaeta ligniaria NRRL 30616 TaxID=1408157 RepID=A0A1J7IXL7_9PEZI|nr:hypothetical protein CONLIGDRAFT_504570 [Coniochaeta ligniaria NRRL 30616]